jgi:hypothetical protein
MAVRVNIRPLSTERDVPVFSSEVISGPAQPYMHSSRSAWRITAGSVTGEDARIADS